MSWIHSHDFFWPDNDMALHLNHSPTPRAPQHGTPSPWNPSPPAGSGYDSLTLPPINPDANFEDQQLPFDNSQYHNTLPQIGSPSPLLPGLSSYLSNSILHPRDLPRLPTNQVAQLPNPIVSQYMIRESESPDPFGDFTELTPPHSPAEMPPLSRNITRASSVVDLTESSPQEAQSRKRKAENGYEGRALKKVRQSSSPCINSRSTLSLKRRLSDVEVVDLKDIDNKKQCEEFKLKQRAEAIRQQNEEDANRPLRLAAFQCIICMDNPTDLTVTHCGHLFCSECLHSALHAGDKKSCPVCRTVVSPGKPGQKKPKNGSFALEMKLMSVNKRGKQPIRLQ